MKTTTIGATALALCLAAASPLTAQPADEWLWLEDVEGEKALAWVEEQNAASTAELEAVPEFAAIHQRGLEIYDSSERLPDVEMLGDHLYDFWQDAEHVRGVWRRTTLASLAGGEPVWEVVLDLDALAAAEGESWVWKGAECLAPDDRRCMVSLSRGGGDAVVHRELDTVAKAFVDGGFTLPEAKSWLSWVDADTLWVATDFGPGTLTTSGYPFVLKEWKRATPLATAREVFRGEEGDVAVASTHLVNPEGSYLFVERSPAFFQSVGFLALDGRLVWLDLPRDARTRGVFRDHLLVSLRSDWTVGGATYPADSLLAIDLDDFLAGSRRFERLFEPSPRVSLGDVETTRDAVLVTTLDNVRGRLWRLRPGDGDWSRQEVALPGTGSVSIEDAASTSGTFFLTYTDFLTPSGLWAVQGDGAPQRLRSEPEFFDAAGMRTVQYEATSADGTRIPYFVVLPPGFEADAANPTLLYGYGGFEVPMLPKYSAQVGQAWLARGGVYAQANIRGGGEFGPGWHRAALRENRPRAFEDFIAVAEDLVARGITSPEHLGIMGGSNGGLLVGAAFTRRPDLFGAVVCTVPLLDMLRYDKLLAGASWVAEYGDPDVAQDWAFLRTWSPYHNLEPEAEYPRVFFRTSTRDDRVHPGHARKMVARMRAQGSPVYYYENTEGGHAGAATNAQKAYASALDFAYLWKMLR